MKRLEQLYRAHFIQTLYIISGLPCDVGKSFSVGESSLDTTGAEAFHVMQANGATSFTWTAPPGVTRLSELLIVAGEAIAGWLLMSQSCG
jgi:hypothetical protein